MSHLRILLLTWFCRRQAFAKGTEKEHKWLRLNPCGIVVLPKLRIVAKPWQTLCMTFLHNARQAFGGAMIGDEMGLGKVYASSLFSLIARHSKLFYFYNRIMHGSQESRAMGRFGSISFFGMFQIFASQIGEMLSSIADHSVQTY